MGFQEAISFDELYTAMRQCACGVRWKYSVSNWLANSFENIVQLQRQLADGTYCISPYTKFVIHEPKTRFIASTQFRDRVVQRSLCNNGLYDDFVRGFIYDNCACLKGRGISFAFNRLKAHMQQYYRKYGTTGWVLRMDLSKFFDTIPHRVAIDEVVKRVHDPWVREYVINVVNSYKDQRGYDKILLDPFGERGIGLGSQISQLIALSVLDPIDHYIKDVRQVRHYLRYMDDFVIINSDKNFLKELKCEIEFRLNKIGLRLNNKTTISRFNQGIWFLKRKHICTSTGKIITRTLSTTFGRERRKLKQLSVLLHQHRIDIHHVFDQYGGWKAYASQTNSNNRIQRMNTFFVDLFNLKPEDIPK